MRNWNCIVQFIRFMIIQASDPLGFITVAWVPLGMLMGYIIKN